MRAITAFGGLWITAFLGEEVIRVDPETGNITKRIPTGAGPEGITAAFGSVWVVAQDAGELLRIDPQTMTVNERITIGVGARLVTADQHSLYVSHYRDGKVLRIDAETSHIRRSRKLCNGPQGMAFQGGHLWVTCTVDNRVLVLDPATLDVLGRLKVPEAPDPILIAPDGSVLTIAQQGPTVVRLDPNTRDVLDRHALGDTDQLYDRANIDAVITGHYLWVTSFSDNVVLRTPLT